MPTLDEATVSASAFDWLCKLSASYRKSGAALLQVEDRVSLRLDNYVGVVQTPCGTCLEILPKHADHPDDKEWSRLLLRKMLLSFLDLPVRDAGLANIELFKSPLTEWVMTQFLLSLDHLIKRGIRFDYQSVEEEQRFLRGQLDVAKQMRQPVGRQHFFQLRHDIFSPNRPENRLLKTALDKVCRHAKEPNNWRLAHELAGLLSEVPCSKDTSADFRLWRKDRLMAHYQPVKPWCELVLGEHMPTAVKGIWHGISLLFPMEKLFEKYVAAKIKASLKTDLYLNAQVASQTLCQHKEKGFFTLKPDMLLKGENKQRLAILDTKWKLLDKLATNYGLSQSDFYQLFAYGHKYLDGNGVLMLIYPKTNHFDKTLPVFGFSSQLHLWVAPFDLDNDVLVLEGMDDNQQIIKTLVSHEEQE
jgi:5-methylcytosine-specific restriction enzyme subunit McrC